MRKRALPGFCFAPWILEIFRSLSFICTSQSGNCFGDFGSNFPTSTLPSLFSCALDRALVSTFSFYPTLNLCEEFTFYHLFSHRDIQSLWDHCEQLSQLLPTWPMEITVTHGSKSYTAPDATGRSPKMRTQPPAYCPAIHRKSPPSLQLINQRIAIRLKI